MEKKTPLSIFKNSNLTEDDDVQDDDDNVRSTSPILPSRRLSAIFTDAQAGTSMYSSTRNPSGSTSANYKTSATSGTATVNTIAPVMPPAIKPIRVAATPPYYTGSKNNCPHEFISAYLRAAECNGWTEDMQVRQFPIFLKDKALAWYEAKTAERVRLGETNWTWDILKNEFLNTNGPIEARKDQLEWKILTLKQSRDENCSEFLIKLDNLCNRLDPKMSDARRIKLCIRGLHKDAIQAVNMRNPKTHAELVELLAKYDETYIISGNEQYMEDEIVHLAIDDSTMNIEVGENAFKVFLK